MNDGLTDLWAWVHRLTVADLPAAPFSLHPGQMITDTDKWLRKIKEDAKDRNAGLRAGGPIQKDLRELYRAVETLPE